MDPPGYTGIDKFQIPYDICCPTVRGFLANRTCSCKMSFFEKIKEVTYINSSEQFLHKGSNKLDQQNF